MFDANSQRTLQISDLLRRSGSGVQTGSVELRSAATGVIVGQLAITYSSGGKQSLIDEEFAVPSAASSGILRGVSSSSAAVPIISVANVSSAAQVATVRCVFASGPTATFALALTPRSSRLIRGCREGIEESEITRLFEPAANGADVSTPVGVEVKGTAGALAAFGVTPHLQDDATELSSVPFVDISDHKGSTTFVGVPIGATEELNGLSYHPTVTVTNFSAYATEISIEVSKTADGATRKERVIQSTLPPQAVATYAVTLPEPSPHMQNSVVVGSDGAPSDVESRMSVQSTDLRSAFDIPGKDQKDPKNGGTHPWSLSPGTESYLLLYNSGVDAQTFDIAINSSGHIWERLYSLKPAETRSFSLRELAAKSIKDDIGRVIPSSAREGTAQWFTGVYQGRGRLAQIDSANQLARNFSCDAYTFICGAYSSTGQTTLAPGSTSYMGITPTFCTSTQRPSGPSCFGTTSGQQLGSITYNWNTDYPAIVSIQGPTTNSSVQLSGGQPGTSAVGCSIEDSYFCSTSLYNTFKVVASPPTISIQFSGSKTTGDSLQFAKAGVCTEALGPVACSDFFRYSFEGKAIVSDNASNWTVMQTFVSGRIKGIYKSGSTFDTLYGTQSDGPASGFTQTTNGLPVFWIDSPATATSVSGDPIDSLTSVKNYSVQVCNTISSGVCGSYQWYVKLVVSPGAHLDTVHSIAGQGSMSTNF